MGRTGRKGKIHKVKEFEIFSDVIEVNSLAAKITIKHLDYYNSQAKRRLLPKIEYKILDDVISENKLFDGIYRRDYTIRITSPQVNIGDYRPLKLIKMIKEFQKYDNFSFYEAVQPLDVNGKVIKENMPYFKFNSVKDSQQVRILDLLKVSKLIIETYGYYRGKDNQVENFNWLRTTGQKAFDILTNCPRTQFNDKCYEQLNVKDVEIDSMLNWIKFSYDNHKFIRDYRPLFKKDYCYFEDVDKITSLIPVYRHIMFGTKVKYFIYNEK